MQDAMDEQKFVQVVNLINKNPNNDELAKLNENGKNIFHIFAENVKDMGVNETLASIFVELKERQIDPTLLDNEGKNALHYACSAG